MDALDAWEVVSAVSEFSLVDDLDETLSMVSVSTATGFPALPHAVAVEEDVVSQASTAIPILSFKEALLLGGGGVASTKAIALQRAKTRLGRIERKPRKTRVVDALDVDDFDPTEEYWTRKARGARLHRLRAPRAALCVPIPEEPADQEGFDDYYASDSDS